MMSRFILASLRVLRGNLDAVDAVGVADASDALPEGLMANEQESGRVEPDDQLPDTERQPAVEPEFKVIVRKLEVPARPRGVLAE
jgi:hypothetical protein